MYAACRVGSLLESFVRRYVLLADAPYQYVGGHNGVCERCRYTTAVVAQFDGNVSSIFWERYEENILERFLDGLRLIVSEPFLKKRRERVAVDYLLRAVVAHRNLTIALQRQLAEPVFLAIPSWHTAKLVHGNGLLVGVSCEIVVYTQRCIFKIALKILRKSKGADKQEQ